MQCCRKFCTEYSFDRDSILKVGTLIKMGDYPHYRLFVLHPGKLYYYELVENARLELAYALDEFIDKEKRRKIDEKFKLRGVMLLHSSGQCTFIDSTRKIQITGLSPTGTRLSWQLQAKTEREYSQWAYAIRIAMRPHWQKDTRICQICDDPFTFFHRPHHCRACGYCICSACISFQDTIPRLGYYTSVPVCQSCHPVMNFRYETGTKVLVFGRYSATIEFNHMNRIGVRFLNDKTRVVHLKYVELYSDLTKSANLIKSAMKSHLARRIFKTEMYFNTWNLLESIHEHQSLYHPPPMPLLEDHTLTEDDYIGIHLEFPLEMDTVFRLVEQFRDGIVLDPLYVERMLLEAQLVFTKASTPVLEYTLVEKLTIVGDLHAQLEDLLTIFTLNGFPSNENPYLFNGDLIDRGSHGVEILMILFAFKLVQPSSVLINRGNHECRMVSRVFGFYHELVSKYHRRHEYFFDLFQTIFDQLPLVTLIDSKVFVCHGGLSNRSNVTISHLKQIKHQREPPIESKLLQDELFVHLLWSDPKSDGQDGFTPSARGAGVEFGADITMDFCKRNKLKMIIRSHECKQDGYDVLHQGQMITIFSASHYCGTQTNRGAYLVLTSDFQHQVFHFEAQPLQLNTSLCLPRHERFKQLQTETLKALGQLIQSHRSCLVWATGDRHSRLEWAKTLRTVLKIDSIPFLLYSYELDYHSIQEESAL